MRTVNWQETFARSIQIACAHLFYWHDVGRMQVPAFYLLHSTTLEHLKCEFR